MREIKEMAAQFYAYNIFNNRKKLEKAYSKVCEIVITLVKKYNNDPFKIRKILCNLYLSYMSAEYVHLKPFLRNEIDVILVSTKIDLIADFNQVIENVTKACIDEISQHAVQNDDLVDLYEWRTISNMRYILRCISKVYGVKSHEYDKLFDHVSQMLKLNNENFQV